MPDGTPTKIDLAHAAKYVVFKITDCCTGRHYSLAGLSNEEAERLTNRLAHFEQLTWGQLAGLPRENGLTSENPDSGSFRMIDEENTCPKKLVEQYYFHIRIEPRGTFRVFGYQFEHYFCITHIDPDGRIHGH